jgi:predicted permease
LPASLQATDGWIVGRTLTVDDKPYTIVGVAAAGFDGLEAHALTDIWLPVTALLPPHWVTSYGSQVLTFMTRLRSDADRSQATAIADLTYRRYLDARVLPSLSSTVRPVFAGRHMRLRDASAGLSTIGLEYRRPLLILMGSVGVILLLCCANVANLLLARQRTREPEFAVRLSLGAKPGRLARQLLTETLFLTGLGALLGLALARWGSEALVRLLPESRVPIALDLTPDARVFAFATMIALLSAIGVGLVPAWRAARTNAGSTLTQHTRSVVRPRVSRSLVVAQLAGSLVLLVTALLMARTLQNLRLLDLGFSPAQVITFDVSLLRTFPAAAKAALYQRIVDRLEMAPGVEAATYSRESIYARGGSAGTAAVPGQEQAKADHAIALLTVGPRFFETTGIMRTRGRLFAADDHRPERFVTVINETTARYFFGTTDAIGRRLQMHQPGEPSHEVIGVVKDAQHYGAREQPCGGRVAYLPMDPTAAAGPFLVRGSIGATDLQRLVRDELSSVGETALLERLRALDTDVLGLIARERMVGRLAGGFALLALAIAAVGVYGLLAYAVSQRSGELGVRAALGAAPPVLRRMVLREALTLVLFGVSLGIPLAIATVRVLSTLLFGVSSADPTTFVGAVMVLAVTAAIAAWLPARRAATADPAGALRGWR